MSFKRWLAARPTTTTTTTTTTSIDRGCQVDVTAPKTPTGGNACVDAPPNPTKTVCIVDGTQNCFTGTRDQVNRRLTATTTTTAAPRPHTPVFQPQQQAPAPTTTTTTEAPSGLAVLLEVMNGYAERKYTREYLQKQIREYLGLATKHEAGR